MKVFSHLGNHSYNLQNNANVGLSFGHVLQVIAEVCTACNDARIEAKNGMYKAVGAPTEAALIVLAEKLGLSDPAEQHAADKAREADPEGSPDAATKQYAARPVLLPAQLKNSLAKKEKRL